MLARVYAHRSAITLHNFIDQCLKNVQMKTIRKSRGLRAQRALSPLNRHALAGRIRCANRFRYQSNGPAQA